MPVRTGASQNQLQSNTTILDLRGLIDDDLKLIDVQGREWPIAADLPLRTALVLLQHAQAWESGEMTGEVFDATVSGMHAILRRRTPTVTRDEVLDGFSVGDMIRAIGWLSLAMRTQASKDEPNGAVPASASSMDVSPETPKPKRSRARSREET